MQQQLELTADRLWTDVSSRLREALNETTYKTWFGDARALDLTADRFVIAVPNDFSKTWIRGIANVRGQLLPVVDLRAFLGGGATNTNRSTRVLVAHHREVPAGLLVDEVLGFRRFNEGEFSGSPPPTISRCERYLAGAFRRGTESWPVFSLRTLLESPEFLQAAAS